MRGKERACRGSDAALHPGLTRCTPEAPRTRIYRSISEVNGSIDLPHLPGDGKLSALATIVLGASTAIIAGASCPSAPRCT